MGPPNNLGILIKLGVGVLGGKGKILGASFRIKARCHCNCFQNSGFSTAVFSGKDGNWTGKLDFSALPDCRNGKWIFHFSFILGHKKSYFLNLILLFPKMMSFQMLPSFFSQVNMESVKNPPLKFTIELLISSSKSATIELNNDFPSAII